ncbi:hypothetical protein AX17_001746 [Amanita inopinata Kibby_2008]|nr:hypothetical protein AX17_001746 [Amanita inopinata Kibby_2008]
MDAEAPFDSSALADTILRSCDNVEFYVVAPILRLMSPIFNDMFDLSQGPAAMENELKNKLPVVPLLEDSKTLRHLLLVMYPNMQAPRLDDWDLMLKVGKAAQKYCMEIVENKVRTSSFKRPWHGTRSLEEKLQMYTTTVQVGWWSEATMAAQSTLHVQLDSLPHIDQLRDISGAEFHCYLDFRMRCERLSQIEQTNERLKPRGWLSVKEPLTDSGHQQLDNRMATCSDSTKPFDSSAEADLILRSSDRTNFFVLEALIRLASPVLNDIIQKNQDLEPEKREMKNGLPVICVEEDGQTLRQLLFLIYPYVEEWYFETVERYARIGRAARRYKMVAVAERLQKQFLASSLIVHQPFRSFAIAITFQWGEVAKVAAKDTLNVPLRDLGYVSELEEITGSDLYWLVQYRSKCAEAACGALQKDELFTSSADDGGKSTFATHVLEQVKACPRGTNVSEACDSQVEKLEQKPDSSQSQKKLPVPQHNLIIKILKKRDGLAALVEEAIAKVLSLPLRLLDAANQKLCAQIPLNLECCKQDKSDVKSVASVSQWDFQLPDNKKK